MASPLFIFAATVCCFIADRNDANPDCRLQQALHIGSDISQLDATYLPVVNNLIMGLSIMRRDRVLQEFRRIVGAIIVLAIHYRHLHWHRFLTFHAKMLMTD